MGILSSKSTTSFKSIYSIPVTKIGGASITLESYKNNLMLITNVASHWGLTNRCYSDFIQLEKEYADKGLKILAFPCNQFMNQESGTESEILEFVRAKGANFDVFAKVDVNGENASELFKYLRLNSNLQGGIIGWNFGKFLVGKDENSIENGIII